MKLIEIKNENGVIMYLNIDKVTSFREYSSTTTIITFDNDRYTLVPYQTKEVASHMGF